MSVNANPLLRLLLNAASPGGNLPNTSPALPNPFTGAGGNNLVMGAANDLWPVLANNQLPLNVDQLLNLPNSGGMFTPVSPEQTQINLAALNNFLVNAGDNQTQSESLGQKLSRLVNLLTGQPNQPNAAPVNNNPQPVNDPPADNAPPMTKFQRLVTRAKVAEATNQQTDPNNPQPVQDNKNNKDDKNNKNDERAIKIIPRSPEALLPIPADPV
jgi:hypothetical protein